MNVNRNWEKHHISIIENYMIYLLSQVLWRQIIVLYLKKDKKSENIPPMLELSDVIDVQQVVTSVCF